MQAVHGHQAAHQQNGGWLQHILSRKWSFLVTFVLVMFVTVSICQAIGFIPDSTDSSGTDASGSSQSPLVTVNASPLLVGPEAASVVSNVSGEVPAKIVVPAIKLSATISNPNTTNVDTLDNYLLTGAVRYPTSATLGEPGNMILFGHSSYLPIVHNQAYKTFDGIQNLKKGDQIYVYSNENEYVYSVETEQQESATSDAIPLTTTGYTLTLSTCDSFGQKTDRFVVTATLVGSYPLGSQS